MEATDRLGRVKPGKAVEIIAGHLTYPHSSLACAGHLLELPALVPVPVDQRADRSTTRVN